MCLIQSLILVYRNTLLRFHPHTAIFNSLFVDKTNYFSLNEKQNPLLLPYLNGNEGHEKRAFDLLQDCFANCSTGLKAEYRVGKKVERVDILGTRV